ncbi:unnamed protein product [Hanseniaspora opuntiae]
MDMMGDIVEKDPLENFADIQITENDVSPGFDEAAVNNTGFPALSDKKTLQSWRVRFQEKKVNNKKVARREKKPEEPKPFNNEDMTEAERIHLENINLMMGMSTDQIEKERQEIMNNMNPKVLEKLIKRFSNAQSKDNDDSSLPIFTDIDTNKYWVGGTNKISDLPKLDDSKVNQILNISEDKKVRFEEPEPQEEVELNYPEIENEDDYVTDDYQFLQKMKDTDSKELLKDVHFVTKKQIEEYEPLSIDDPEFEKKLKDKYFPELSTEVDKMKWMEPLEDDSNITNNKVIDTVADLRFDFKGNLCAPQAEVESTKDGLHHHAENPDLKGYTLEELQNYAMSTYPGQKCIALQTLGRIMYKVKAERYYQLIPEIDQEQFDKLDGDITPIIEQIYGMLWAWINHLKIVEIIESNLSNKNLSIKNYATEAMWMLKQGEYKQKKIQEKRRSMTEEQ